MIALMILDHVREYFHVAALQFQPTDLDQTTPLLFATRWVTHLCAPTFVFLAGVSISLQRDNGKRGGRLSGFLLTRGLWLILLELTLIVFALNFAWPFVFLQVIWAIGIGMILMAALVWLPRPAILVLGLVLLIAGPAVAAIAMGNLAQWGLLAGLFLPGPLPGGFSAYPPLPWFAFMAIGYGVAPLFVRADRARSLPLVGAGLLTAFVLLRATNLYGDTPWTLLPNDAVKTALSFLNISKYPPSLLFGLATLGVSLLLTSILARLNGASARLFEAFGRVPLLIYVVHLYLVHGLAMALGAALGFAPSLFIGFLADSSALKASGWGVNLAWTYVVWVLIVLSLWPLASRFAAFKAERRRWWTSYL